MVSKSIVVFADTVEAYEELCSGARALDCRPVALFAGSADDAERVSMWGARVVHVGEVPEGALYEDLASAFEQIIRFEKPALIMARASKRTQCIAGRLAVRLGAPVVSDALRIDLDGEVARFVSMIYGGAAECVEQVSGLAIVLVGSGVFEAGGACDGGMVEHSDAALEFGPIKLIERWEKQEETVDLGSAKRVVCVGRGVQSIGNLEAAKEFATRIGAEMACSRPIVETEGWMPRSRYLGVSGAVVKPDIYIGLGVSGQVQHTVGMADSQFVVAVNKDKNAPLMHECDLGLVADLETVLPVLSSI
ncbi:electron transfer flavoprotein subunit alpha/FixB family protein [Rubneribacter badeniensis]|uniref:Electron transfer flavoprotein subunit alpha/FixB family protein n=1 Tax=Rubneribacter badeniensis TaxID=2070688 RepID=A0A2K2U2A0_9ACTN|nr:electron transfer flavoprotein subunit alpha/FixB family protein [Rubneribacter badeniensis]PNV64456.1 electron transfer flavoprotein subunit alpha/FixB family protein [Rubneribacter badeniensis]CVH76548.1 Electron transfer flavoprotein subunit alpha [Coriobacteriaceae bacterium CHKCI002]